MSSYVADGSGCQLPGDGQGRCIMWDYRPISTLSSIIQGAFQMSAAVDRRGSMWRNLMAFYWCNSVYECWCLIWCVLLCICVKTCISGDYLCRCMFKFSLLCIDSWNGIQKCHLQCRSLPCNAAAVSWLNRLSHWLRASYTILVKALLWMHLREHPS